MLSRDDIDRHLTSELVFSVDSLPGFSDTIELPDGLVLSRGAGQSATAPRRYPVCSSNRARHRLSRTGNRQLNAARHRIALTQLHWHPPAQALIARRRANGDGGLEALRVLKRRLSDVVYRALHADTTIASTDDPTITITQAA
jgi:hypothetical protein